MGGKGSSQRSKLEEAFFIEVIHAGLPKPERQHKFHPVRKWQFDFAWPDKRLAVEIEGGTWSQGRHTRPRGYAADCEKYNAAARLGWVLLRFTGDMVKDGTALATVKSALERGAA